MKEMEEVISVIGVDEIKTQIERFIETNGACPRDMDCSDCLFEKIEYYYDKACGQTGYNEAIDKYNLNIDRSQAVTYKLLNLAMIKKIKQYLSVDFDICDLEV